MKREYLDIVEPLPTAERMHIPSKESIINRALRQYLLSLIHHKVKVEFTEDLLALAYYRGLNATTLEDICVNKVKEVNATDKIDSRNIF